MKIAVFGSGYVGLVTGTCFADVGHTVICVDVDQTKVENLRQGIVHIYEPGLAELVRRNVDSGRLTFTTNASKAVAEAEIIFIAVGTPPLADGSADLRYVLDVAGAIGDHVNGDKIVVDKSTVPVGTAGRVLAMINARMAERGLDHHVEVCSNPEFLKEDEAIEDFTRGARIVIGTTSDWVRSQMRALYAPYNRNHDKIIYLGVREAELTKYAANAMLACKISFMNEIAGIAEAVGADIEQVRLGIGSDPRIGYHFIYPGAGYGGSCFPKDVRALVHMATEKQHNPELLLAIDAVNQRQQGSLFTKLQGALGDELAGRKIAVWGLAFKPNTDDMREAPSRRLLETLWEHGASARVFDPKAMQEARRLYGDRTDLVYCDSQQDAIAGADALVICTEWKQFRVVDFAEIRAALKFPILVDGRNLYDPQTVKDCGLLYYAVGRGDSLRKA